MADLQEFESENKQVVIILHSYRRPAMSDAVLSHIVDEFYYYPNVGYYRPSREQRCEIFTLHPIGGETHIKIIDLLYK